MDAVVQSTDKNFMVPVGGALVAAGKRDPSLVRDKILTFGFELCVMLHASDAAYPSTTALTTIFTKQFIYSRLRPCRSML